MQWGGTRYPWSQWRIILLFVTFGILIVVWIIIQFWKGDSATVPPRLLAKRSIASAAWFAFSMGSSFLVLIFYLPVWFQAVKGSSPLESGIRNLPLILGFVIFSIISGIIVTAIGYCEPPRSLSFGNVLIGLDMPFMVAASLFSTVGIGLLITLKPDSGSAAWLGYQAIVCNEKQSPRLNE
jgi:MFS family permease